MHRSGTSLLMQLLEMMGVHLGPADSFNPPDASDPRGYLERRSVWALNEKMLAALDASWFRVAEVDVERLGAADLGRWAAQAREALEGLEAHRPWAVKDPRLCLLFPVWRAALAAPVCLLAYRRPLQVAESLRSRNGFPLPFGVALWERYTVDALRHTRGLPRMLVPHRSLIEDPQQAVGAIQEGLESFGVIGLRRPSPGLLASAVDRRAFRSRGSAEEERRLLNSQQAALLAGLEDGSLLAGGTTPQLSDEARRQLDSSGELQERLTRCDERSRGSAQQLERRVEELDGLLAGVLESGRWKLGRAAGDLWRRLSGRPPKADPAAAHRRIRREHARREESRDLGNGPCGPEEPSRGSR